VFCYTGIEYLANVINLSSESSSLVSLISRVFPRGNFANLFYLNPILFPSLFPWVGVRYLSNRNFHRFCFPSSFSPISDWLRGLMPNTNTLKSFRSSFRFENYPTWLNVAHLKGRFELFDSILFFIHTIVDGHSY